MSTIKFVSNIDGSPLWETDNLGITIPADAVKISEGVYAITPTPEVEPEPEPAPVINPIEFKLLFTSPERIAIKNARATDEILEDFYSIIEDPRLTSVDLGLQSTIDGVNYLASTGLIEPERVDVILAGTHV